MPHQNRVNPFGQIEQASYRGQWFGNRGCLHNPSGQLVRQELKRESRWIYCLLEFKNRRRPLLQPNCYTELFFLDEATALAAGHRPCFECQRERASEFRDAWNRSNPFVRTFKDLDASLRAAPGAEVLHTVTGLPNGTMVSIEEQPYLIWNGETLLWSPQGYQSMSVPTGPVHVLTPAPIVNVLREGFTVQVAPCL